MSQNPPRIPRIYSQMTREGTWLSDSQIEKKNLAFPQNDYYGAATHLRHNVQHNDDNQGGHLRQPKFGVHFFVPTILDTPLHLVNWASARREGSRSQNVGPSFENLVEL